MPSTNQSNKLNPHIPHAGKLVAIIVGLIILAVVFIYGVLVGLYQITPFALIKPLVQVEAPVEDTPASDTITPPVRDHLPVRIKTNLLNADAKWFNLNQSLDGPGGGISVFEDGILVAKDYFGAIWYYRQSTDDFYQLKIFLPINNNLDLPQTTVDGRQITPLRYNNLLAYREAGRPYLLAIYGYFDKTNNCRTLRLSKAALPADWYVKPTAEDTGVELDWEHLFTAAPCLEFDGKNQHVTGFQEGAALLKVDQDVYFTTGDMGKDGIGIRTPIMTQSEDSDFGRVFKYSITSGKVSRVASGLRNAQGLTVDDQGQLWATDQGPMGGDEVNMISFGKNYGWPYATYGVDYTSLDNDQRGWPYLEVAGRHDDYEKPKFMWAPSISPGSITYVQDFHPHWNNNMLVGSLLGGAIIRLTLADGNIIGAEPIPLQARIRSVLNAHGRIYILTDKGYFGYLTPRSTAPQANDPTSAAFAVLAGNGCIECHSNPATPALSQVFNQPIASQGDVAYSSALKQMQARRWTATNLSAFLQSPTGFAPGTAMPGLNMQQENIEAVVDALRQLQENQQ